MTTLEQYLEKVLDEINEADKSSQIDAILKNAEKTLKESNIPDIKIRWFWTQLYELVKSGKDRHLIKEAQAQAALNALVSHALAAIAELSGKAAK